jgi:nicotinate-nucleotide--dimethylbenzimidazole phosphoribosyltransferase
MLANFASGGAAICVLAKQAGARLIVVDAGTVTPFEHPDVQSRRIGNGTNNAAKGPAMSRPEAEAGIVSGIHLAATLAAEGIGVVALGEMGIANSTSAAALAAALLPADEADVCGPGTGVDEEGVKRKVAAVRAALDVNAEALADPISTLAAVGGFEIATLTGIILECAALGVPVVLDGFITGAAALVAARIAPDSVGAMIAGHRSSEPGAFLILEDLELRPLLELDMRLGEGSGAALALPLVRSSLAILQDMATFEDAGVTDAGA